MCRNAWCRKFEPIDAGELSVDEQIGAKAKQLAAQGPEAIRAAILSERSASPAVNDITDISADFAGQSIIVQPDSAGVSVRLTPISERNSEDPESIHISNGEWAALTAFAKHFGEDVPTWNGCHDATRYTPEQLRAIATRLEQVKTAPEWLNWLAENGGAELS